MKFSEKLWLLVTLQLLLVNSALSQTQTIPSIDAVAKSVHHQASLSGRWGFYWGGWVPLDKIISGDYVLSTIELPNYLTAAPIPNVSDSPFVHGIGTYLLEINNLKHAFSRPAIEMRNISEAWQAWWIESNGETQFLGKSGKIAVTPEEQEFRDYTYLLELPHDSQQGILVIYISAHNFDRTGVYGDLTITEQESGFRSILTDLASRAFLIGIGLYVVIQNMAFYLQRRKEKTLLLLAVFALIGLARAAFSSGYVEYFVTIPAFSTYSLKIEYILVVWPGVAALQLMVHYFPLKWGKKLITLAYIYLLAVVLITAAIPLSLMTLYLFAYQLSIVTITAICLFVIARGLLLNMPDANHFFLSFLPLIFAVFNDIIAAKSPSYNFYIAEYALFVFLFIQTQVQASRFVSALDTAEHLTSNLKAEVDFKTRELSIRNMLLEEKAEHLEEQHHHIKLLSETDHLTGLYNRQTLENHSNLQFQLAQTYQQPLSLVMMDLDNFKRINDQYGHITGDECLVFMASYLRGYKLRKRDIIARYGGEEIVILLNDTSIEAAKEIVQGICDGLSKIPIQGNHPDIYLTASFGIAELSSCKAEDIQSLMSCADKALYLAKLNGRNRVEIFEP